MCLNSIVSDNLSEEQQRGKGWKVFVKGLVTGDLYFQFLDIDRNLKVDVNQWITAENKKLMVRKLDGSSFNYLSGFHIFSSYDDAVNWCKFYDGIARLVIVKVEYRKARIIGEQGGRAIIVADEMFVPKETTE